jgi:xanthine dehydrogenase accessory factor
MGCCPTSGSTSRDAAAPAVDPVGDFDPGTSPLRAALELEARGVPFVLATVVRAVAPTSAKPGDKAIVTEDGVRLGWIGGSCAEPIVREEARAALADGQHRLVHITPDPDLPADRSGLTVHPMTCYSGGAIEIHLEPNLPRPRLLVFGGSPIARALEQLGTAMGYRCTRVERESGSAAVPLDAVDPEGTGPLFAVVATHGTFDLEALEHAARLRPDYWGVVVSRRRAGQVKDRLRARGVGEADIARLRAPAGHRWGARAPEEVALSILAEIVAERRSDAGAHAPSDDGVAAADGSAGGCCHG